MAMKQTREIKFNDVAKEVIKRDKDFLTEMEVGDARAVVLNDGVVVVFGKLKELNKSRSKMEIFSLNSIRIDANLTEMV